MSCSHCVDQRPGAVRRWSRADWACLDRGLPERRHHDYLLAQGVAVTDVNRFDRADRRRRGKSEPLKRYAAREVFHLVRPVQPQPTS
ncbi:hypothetical protein GCM10010503_45230 [Streptomyces lucensis JCM 4490]|uniref:Uncharacterized protein n=1 Tax=Streptomyces lucensis JCM 4490 TaxID=1306176 RepID=A0A918MT48_9ACTN|nr:hypothetical protein GCM10010503_45230 [Streptomyces lucensis JCM 4490]